MDFFSLRDWLLSHDWQVMLVTAYLLLNVGPRPHPDDAPGAQRILWAAIDRICFLSAGEVPGHWKWVGAESDPERLPPVAPSPRVHSTTAETRAAHMPAMPPTVVDAQPPYPEDDPPKGAA